MSVRGMTKIPLSRIPLTKRSGQPAPAKAQVERVKEMAEFRAKQLHQKAGIARTDILATCNNEGLAAVTGQIIRSGIFQDQAFTEAFPFTLRLRLIRKRRHRRGQAGGVGGAGGQSAKKRIAEQAVSRRAVYGARWRKILRLDKKLQPDASGAVSKKIHSS